MIYYGVKNTKTGEIIRESLSLDYDEAVAYASDSPLMRKVWTVVPCTITINEIMPPKKKRKPKKKPTRKARKK